MRARGEGWQKWRGRPDRRGGGIDTIGAAAAVKPRAVNEVIEINDSSDSDKKPAATVGTDKIIRIDSSSDESSSKEVSANATLNATSRLPPKANQGKRRKPKKADKATQGQKRRKNAAVPAFTVDSSDPFASSSTGVHFVVRGKPLPQYRDKPGWNLTRYNPSKRLQNEFRELASLICVTHAGFVPNFGSDAEVKVEVQFRFPPPKTGRLKNTADIDNLSKFLLDACNKTFYGDDGQVVSLIADKGYDDSHGCAGFTSVTIQVIHV